MIIFAAPVWLWVASAVGAAGVWALWRGQRRVRAVPSIRLWREIVPEAVATRRRRGVDPLWLLVFLAAVLAALALAGPRWKWGSGPDENAWARVQWAVRSAGGGVGGGMGGGAGRESPQVEAWIRLMEGGDLPGTVRVLLGGTQKDVSTDELRKGVALAVPPSDAAGGRLKLALLAGKHVMAEAEFRRPAMAGGRPFALLEYAAAGEPGVDPMDPALERVFAIQPGARREDPSVRPAVALVRGPGFSLSQLPASGGEAAEKGGGTLVIAQSDTALPGLVPGETITGPAEGWTPAVATGEAASRAFPWPPYVPLRDVRVFAMRTAQLEPSWQVLATANGRPWIALRTVGGNGPGTARVTLVWLASAPSTETNWPKSASFVLFFAELANRAWEVPAEDGAQGNVVEWERTQEVMGSPQTQNDAVNTTDLRSLLGAVAMVMLLGAVGWFVTRGRS